MAGYTHSCVLFKNEDGTPIRFYMRPCNTRQQLKPIIEHGGGEISNKITHNTLRLLEPGANVPSGSKTEYTNSTYVTDCVERNKLLDPTEYRIPESVNQVPTTDEDQTMEVISTSSDNTPRKRKKYTIDDEKKMANYLMKGSRYKHVGGNVLWKNMELAKITSHSWQSMKDHFKKHMMKNLELFASEGDIEKLSPNRKSKEVNKMRNVSSLFHSKEKSKADKVYEFPASDGTQSDDDNDAPRYSIRKSNNKNTQPKQMPENSAQERPVAPKRKLFTEKSPFKGSPKDLTIRGERNEKFKKQSSPAAKNRREQQANGKVTVNGCLSEARDHQRSDEAVASRRDRESTDGGDHQQTDGHFGTDQVEVCTTPRKRRSSSINFSSFSPLKITNSPHCSQRPHFSVGDSSVDSVRSAVNVQNVTDTNAKHCNNVNSSPNSTEDQTFRPALMDYEEQCDDTVDNHKASDVDNVESGSPASTVAFPENDESAGGANQSAEDSGQNLMAYIEDSLVEENSVSDAEDVEEEDEAEIISYLKSLCGDLGVTGSELMDVIYSCSGPVRDAVHWILYGTDTQGFPLWTREDETALESADPEAIHAVYLKYGKPNAEKRILFLETLASNKR